MLPCRPNCTSVCQRQKRMEVKARYCSPSFVSRTMHMQPLTWMWMIPGLSDWLINNCCFPSAVSASYAPPGKSLASVSIIGRTRLVLLATSQGAGQLER
jgi:hypothetical protein